MLVTGNPNGFYPRYLQNEKDRKKKEEKIQLNNIHNERVYTKARVDSILTKLCHFLPKVTCVVVY